MKTCITAAVLTAALLGAIGCAEEAGPRNESDRYQTPMPTARTQSPQATNNQDVTLQAQPASAQIGPSDETQQEQPTLNPNTPSSNTIQPGGRQGVPGTTSRNPGTVPPTVPSGGNTAGAAGR